MNFGLKATLNDCDQAQMRAGIQLKEEKEMTGLESTGKFQINLSFSVLVHTKTSAVTFQAWLSTRLRSAPLKPLIRISRVTAHPKKLKRQSRILPRPLQWETRSP